MDYFNDFGFEESEEKDEEAVVSINLDELLPIDFPDLSSINEVLDLFKIRKRFSFFPSHSLESSLQQEWNDNLYLENGKEYCTWKRIPIGQMAGHLISFVNLWFSPHAAENKEICSTIRNVLLMMPLGIRLPEELLLKDVLDSAPETAQIPSSIDADKIIIKDPLVDHLDSNEQVEVLAFHEWLKQNFTQLKLLENNPSQDQTYCPEYHLVSVKLRTVLGFCALILMRLIMKDGPHIKRYFPYRAWKAIDLLFPEVGLLNISLTAPAPEFLKLVSDALNKNSGHPDAIELLCLLVFQYLKSVINSDKSSQLAKQILEDGCLNALEGNGMGLVTMFQDIKLLYPYIEERQLLSMIVDPKRDSASQEKLIKFLDTYGQPDKLQYSWKWARILSENHFSDLNIKSNLNLCSKFAAILIDKNPNIFQHKGFRNLYNKCPRKTKKWAQSAKHELSMLNHNMNQVSE